MATKTLSSPLVSAFNNIGKLGASAKMSAKLQSDFVGFLNFMEMQNAELNRIKLPEDRKVKRLANLNIASTFGSPGGLLSSLASGALDLAGFLGNFFPGKGKLGKPQSPKEVKAPRITPRGKRLRFGGVKGLGVLNALFTGLDFYQGLQEGESVGKAATGAGASLAGSIIGGILGSALGPIGTFAGASLGGMVGGWVGDRGYEAITGEGKSESVGQKLEKRLKEQEQRQKLLRGDGSFSEVLNKFSLAVERFEKGISQGLFGSLTEQGQEPMEDAMGEVETNYDTPDPSIQDVNQVYTAEGGDDPSPYFNSGFGWRWGRQHNGVDFAHPNPSSPVTILQPGIVDTGYEGGYGNWVAVKHTDGSETFYGHLSKINVKKGQRIESGTVIGNQGSTGRSLGPHVHFEYRPGGPGTKPVDGRSVASRYFRYGGKVSVKPRKANDVTQKLGDVSTNYEQQETQKAPSQTQSKVEPKQNQPMSQQMALVAPQQNNIQNDISQQVFPAPNQSNIPQQVNMIQYYPSYNQGQYITTIVPMMIGGQNNNQKPIVISGGSGGTEVLVIPPPSEGEIVNNLMKTMLLTNLSGS